MRNFSKRKESMYYMIKYIYRKRKSNKPNKEITDNTTRGSLLKIDEAYQSSKSDHDINKSFSTYDRRNINPLYVNFVDKEPKKQSFLASCCSKVCFCFKKQEN